MLLLSISGVFKIALIILGVIFALRFIGQMMQVQRNRAAEQDMLRTESERQREMDKHQKNFGRTTVSKVDQGKSEKGDYTDFEEIKE